MCLQALHRHRRLPGAAALLGMVLYVALVASHVVSQATSVKPERTAQSSVAAAAQISVQAAATGIRACHEPDFAAGDPDSKPNPNAPKTKCPFCVGYAALHMSILGGANLVAYADTVSEPLVDARAQRTGIAASHDWQPRGPPAA